tara:strand:+ start:153 stop:260 length:108 start_codon:yes stop_codon:yes gene_type:complete
MEKLKKYLTLAAATVILFICTVFLLSLESIIDTMF